MRLDTLSRIWSMLFSAFYYCYYLFKMVQFDRQKVLLRAHTQFGFDNVSNEMIYTETQHKNHVNRF